MRRAPDAILAVLAAVHGAAIVVLPTAPVIACGVWWNSNTIAHNFIHRPFFRARVWNRIFSAYQSVITGIPQTVWRERHLAHHAGVSWHPRWSLELVVDVSLIVALWLSLAATWPAFFVYAYLPGYGAGLVLCAIQGHYEHAGATTSHYGRIYNALFFNDGYHVEHHVHPGVHWSDLPARARSGTRSSRWPAILRWLDCLSLERLERLVLRSRLLQLFMVTCHRRAFRRLLGGVPPPRRVLIVGGGLFPRTAIVLRDVTPEADLHVIDADALNLELARRRFERYHSGNGPAVRFGHGRFTGTTPGGGFDLVVVPLAFDGDRDRIYEHPPAPMVIVHDWCWRRRGSGCLVSLLLLKRLNLVRT
jgi:hypothetical protein